MIIMHGGSYDNFHAPYWPIIKNKETMNQQYNYIIINEEQLIMRRTELCLPEVTNTTRASYFRKINFLNKNEFIELMSSEFYYN